MFPIQLCIYLHYCTDSIQNMPLYTACYTTPSNYRPVANFTFLSKILEHAVHKQITGNLQQNNLLSCFRSFIMPTVDTIQPSTPCSRCFPTSSMPQKGATPPTLSFIDLSAAFDTVDRDILRQRRTRSFGIRAKSLQWLDSYLTGRTQSVYLDRQSTTPLNILFKFCNVLCSVHCRLFYTLLTWAASFKLVTQCFTDSRTTNNCSSSAHRRRVPVSSRELLRVSRTQQDGWRLAAQI